MSVQTFTKSGTKAATAAKLPADVFAVEAKNHELLKLAYTAYLANGRANLATTKTRGLVSGGGKKPWRQKGTGRARFGSSRVPQWRHGGVVFGPTGNENYSLNVPAKARRTALRQALSMVANEGKVRVIETFECKDGKAAKAAELLQKMGTSGRVLLVVGTKDKLVERATRNLPDVQPIDARCLNVYDVLNADTVVLDQDALAIISGWLGSPKKATAKESRG